MLSYTVHPNARGRLKLTVSIKILWVVLALFVIVSGLFFSLGLIPAPMGEVKKVIPYSKLAQKK
jgi:hypothetical protein